MSADPTTWESWIDSLQPLAFRVPNPPYADRKTERLSVWLQLANGYMAAFTSGASVPHFLSLYVNQNACYVSYNSNSANADRIVGAPAPCLDAGTGKGGVETYGQHHLQSEYQLGHKTRPRF